MIISKTEDVSRQIFQPSLFVNNNGQKFGIHVTLHSVDFKDFLIANMYLLKNIQFYTLKIYNFLSWFSRLPLRGDSKIM